MSRNEYHEHPEIHNITISSPEIWIFTATSSIFGKLERTEATGITSLASERMYSPCFARVLRPMMPPTLFKQLVFTGRWLVKMPCSKCFHQWFMAILDPHVWHKIRGLQRVMKLKSTMSLNKYHIHGGGRQLWVQWYEFLIDYYPSIIFQADLPFSTAWDSLTWWCFTVVKTIINPPSVGIQISRIFKKQVPIFQQKNNQRDPLLTYFDHFFSPRVFFLKGPKRSFFFAGPWPLTI